MLLFLTGPLGAGKTTAIKSTEQFCYEFCSSCNIVWTDTSLFHTAYTRLAALAFSVCTIVKASGMFTTSVLKVQQMEWRGEYILIIDEITFMIKHELTKLDARLCQYQDCDKIFGGYWGLQTTHQRQ